MKKKESFKRLDVIRDPRLKPTPIPGIAHIKPRTFDAEEFYKKIREFEDTKNTNG